MKPSRIALCLLSIAALLAATATPSEAYSVLTHEAIVDATWDAGIKPLLLARYPAATPAELKAAHAFAYGGCAIQDLGYYPGGSKFFSDLAHYVRSGDFIEALLRDAGNLNEYAFALGAMEHYAADNNGHRIAVNPSVAILYPKLRHKFGNVVTYGDDPSAHLKTEFGFDVLQVAKGHYAPDAYHDYIGFQVSDSLVAKAFAETYSLDVNDIFGNFDLTIETFRRAVSKLIPKATQVAWQIKKDDIQKDLPGITRDKFVYNLSRSSYEKQWSGRYKRPGVGTKILAFFIRILPKVGPLRTLAFRTPTPETEKLFMASFNATEQQYQDLLRQERPSGPTSAQSSGKSTGHASLPNVDFDTGTNTAPGEYGMADKTYAELLDKLQDRQFDKVSPALQSAIVAYYSDPNAPIATKKNKKEWAKIQREVAALKTFTPSPAGQKAATLSPTLPGTAP